MTNTPALRSTIGPPATVDRAFVDRLAWLRNGLPIGRQPDHLDRRALETRRGEIDASLGHRDASAVRNALVTMFATMKAPQGSEADWRAIVTAYVAALDDLPAWAVVEACDAAVKGRGMSLTFAPTVPELRVAVEKLLARHVEERATIEAVLSAKPPAPKGERARVGAGLGELVAGLKAAAEERRRQEREAWEAKHPGPVRELKPGPELAAKLDEWKAEGVADEADLPAVHAA